MPKRLLPFALSALLLPSTLLAQESKPPTEAQPAQQAPEKKPDAFQYFFGKKRDENEKKKEPEAQKAPEAKTPAAVKAPAKPEPVPARIPEAVPEKSVEPVAPAPAPVVEPAPAAPSEVRPEPARVAQPQLAAPPAPAPEPPKAEEPKGDAFRYFFGQASQPVPEEKKEEAAPRKPVNAFDYFFGKDGKADEVEEPQSPPPV